MNLVGIMKNNKYWFIWEITVMVVILFIWCILFLSLALLNLSNKDHEALDNLEQDRIWVYMESIFFERDWYKIWKLNIPWLWFEPNIRYDAICDKVTYKCWKINSLIVNEDLFYAYGEDKFLIFDMDKVYSYSWYELDELWKEQREILLSLKENPRFIFE